MKFTKLTVFAVIIAFLAISLFITFGQEAFIQPVTANFLFVKTPAIPVLYYIAGAFIFGLVIGIFVAVHEHVVMAKRLRELKREFSKKESSDSESPDSESPAAADTAPAENPQEENVEE